MPRKDTRKKRNQKKKQKWFVPKIIFGVFQSLTAFIIVLLLLLAALGVGIGAGYFAYLVEDTEMPTKEILQTELGNITETSKLVYADNSEISKIQTDLMRTTVPSDQISPLLKTAIISTEDEYFEEHKGYVPKAVLRALFSEATGIGSSGGSTLTQQLVKQQILTDETTFKRKANEILLAAQVEKYFSKNEIISTYLNVSPFGRNNKGQNIAGVQEAAKGIFGVNAKDVTLPQAAFIAGLPQSPITYSPYTNTGALKEDLSAGLNRKDIVLFSMYRENKITKAQYDEAKAYDLTKDFLPQQVAEQNDREYLYYTVMNEATKIVTKQLADKDKADLTDGDTYDAYYQKAQQTIQNKGYTIHSTIDKNIYAAMQAGVQNYGYLLDDGTATQVETGNVLMDNKTGRIYGFVGGRNYLQNQNNHAFDTERQAGSSIKPVLVYGPAIDMGLVGSESRVSDYATTWQEGANAGEKIVNATNEGSNTFQTIRESLEWSNNIPAYHLYQDVLNNGGSKQYAYDSYLAKMNYPANANWGVESAPLGTIDVTTLQQTNGFQALANGGVYQEGYLIDSITDNAGNVIYKHEEKPVRIYSEAAASIMNDMMRSVLTTKITTSFKDDIASLNRDLGQADWVGKTGTTNEYRDSWLIVSTPAITISSWTGHDDNTAMNSRARIRSSQYLANLINQVYQADPTIFGTRDKFELSSDVMKKKVAAFTGQTAGKVTVDKKTIETPNKTVESLWAKNGPEKSTFKFGIGGTDKDYEDYWKKVNAYNQANPAKKEDNKEE
ncbi:transglycosylase domain-containing protein [Enterococcus durans]|uniref:transglycosylase domain-containing protein n=1 Tax=Enterococcus durans TaxID=53345 RepID=UPI0009BF908D|nr:transglycosylase domain-containing protein [Enterococcus durans]MCA6741243.1 penicillin-binding protein [Enterococcus durans]MCT4339044.1 penicillin-binding protein [Enterococcus durans]OQO81468.1 transglycosylase [Enterococcus durans]